MLFLRKQKIEKNRIHGQTNKQAGKKTVAISGKAINYTNRSEATQKPQKGTSLDEVIMLIY